MPAKAKILKIIIIFWFSEILIKKRSEINSLFFKFLKDTQSQNIEIMYIQIKKNIINKFCITINTHKILNIEEKASNFFIINWILEPKIQIILVKNIINSKLNKKKNLLNKGRIFCHVDKKKRIW